MLSENNPELPGVPIARQQSQSGRQSHAGSAFGGSQPGASRQLGGDPRLRNEGPGSPYQEGRMPDDRASPQSRRNIYPPGRMDSYGSQDSRYPQFPPGRAGLNRGDSYNSRDRGMYDDDPRGPPRDHRSRRHREEYDMDEDYDQPYDKYGGDRGRARGLDRQRGQYRDEYEVEERMGGRDRYPYDRRNSHDPLGVPFQHPGSMRDYPPDLAYPEEMYGNEIPGMGSPRDGELGMAGGPIGPMSRPSSAMGMSRPSSAMGMSRAGSVMGQSRAASVMGISRPSSAMSRRSRYPEQDLERDLDEYGGVSRHERRYPEEYDRQHDDYDRGGRRRRESSRHHDSSHGRRDSHRQRDSSNRESRRLSSLQIKFKRKGSFVGGISLRDAQHTSLDGRRGSTDGKLKSGGIRLANNEAYTYEDVHADKRSNIRLKMRWHGYSSLTYEIPLDGRENFISLQTLARRVARACSHYFETNHVPIQWERVKLNYLEEVSYGTWQPMLSS